MRELSSQRNRVRQLRGLLAITSDENDRRQVRRCLLKHNIRLALLLRRRQLEAATAGPFDRVVSRQLDAIEVLLCEMDGRRHEDFRIGEVVL